MTNEDIYTNAESKNYIIRSLQRNIEAMQHERNYFHNMAAALREENLNLCVENLHLKTQMQEQKVTLDLEITRNALLETEKQELTAEIKAQKRTNTILTKDLIKMKTKLAEYKEKLSTENLLELLGTSGESSDIVANKKRKT